MKKFLAMTMMAAMATAAHATVTFQMYMEDAQDHSGSVISDTTIFKIITDPEADGLDAITGGSSLNSFVSGDDEVAWTGQMESAYPGELYLQLNGVTRPAVTAGSPDIWVVWYEALTDTGAAAPGEGQWMGYYREDGTGGPTGFDWVMPAEGGSVDYGGAGTALDQNLVGYAQVGAPIPEPTTMLGLLVLSAGALVSNRRRARNHS